MQSPVKAACLYPSAFSYGSQKEISYEFSDPVRQIRDEGMIPDFRPILDSH